MSNTKQLSDSERASAWRESISEEEDKRLQIKHGHWHHDIGINRDEVIQMWIDEGRPDPIVEEVSISISETKQPPAELVEKMMFISTELYNEKILVHRCAEQCAQIAVSYEQEQKALIGQDLVRLVQDNLELMEFVKFIDDNWDDFLKHTNLAKSFHTGKNFQFMNELPFKAKQLLNKNEDGKK